MSKYGILDWPERALGGSYQLLRENFRLLVVLGVIGYLSIEAGFIDAPDIGFELPLWARVVLVFGAIAAVGGHWVGSKILSQVEPDWNYIVEANVDAEDTTVKVTKVTDAVLQDFTVIGGKLAPVPGRSNWYYCRWWNHDPDDPIGHATWTKVKSDLELLGTSPSDIEEEVRDVRESYESRIWKADRLTTHLPMVVRRLHSTKAEELNAALEGHLVPDLGAGTIDGVIDDIIPDDLQPERFERRLKQAQGEDGDTTIGDAIADVENELDGPTPESTSGSETPVATDGGEDGGGE
ncbi:hypothetical protein [Haloarchaeobius sp. DYHT-AS-18]|uniref:hypothetical protein n=1 Tax=Haloarchaeobius sp. DYHT-AS-18 TaxID=3446117 RepID=UPI003EBBA7CC